ncbi:MAG: hypothetical protein JO057_05095 [Chloroflexi bacterium]|nr:hypothetical protein [Chloroflexota bacterium]
MHIRNRAATALVATLGVAALLAPTVSEAAPASPTGAASAGVGVLSTSAPTRSVGTLSGSTSGSTFIPYYIYLDSFHISNTRSRFDDTDLVDLTAMQPPAQAQSVNWGPQDVDNGDHAVGSALGPYSMTSDSSSLLTFNYSIVNSASTADSVFEQMASKGGDAAAAAIAGYIVGGPVGGIVGAGAGYLVGLLSGIIFPNCDGVVAADSVGPLTGAQLASLTASGDYRETRHYAGTNSSTGCGGNSSYDVSWRISLTPPPPPSKVTGTLQGGGGKHLLN